MALKPHLLEMYKKRCGREVGRGWGRQVSLIKVNTCYYDLITRKSAGSTYQQRAVKPPGVCLRRVSTHFVSVHPILFQVH